MAHQADNLLSGNVRGKVRPLNAESRLARLASQLGLPCFESSQRFAGQPVRRLSIVGVVNRGLFRLACFGTIEQPIAAFILNCGIELAQSPRIVPNLRR